MKNKKKVAFFAGLSAFLGCFENFIPLPIPFIRIGISNIPIMLGFTQFGFLELLFIILFKTIFSHLFRGTLFSVPFLIGLSGNLLFLIICFPIYKMSNKFISFISIGIIGATSHNVGQILIAMFFIPKITVFYFGVFIIGTGLVFGLVNGIICNKIYNNLFERYFYD